MGHALGDDVDGLGAEEQDADGGAIALLCLEHHLATSTTERHGDVGKLTVGVGGYVSLFHSPPPSE